MSTKIIGIDLGTTNSAVAVTQNGVPTLIPIAGERILPSVVGMSPRGELIVGAAARNQWVVAPEHTVRSIKRKMGQLETVNMAGQSYTPQEISAFILQAIKQGVEAEIGAPVQRAVITVPAYFNEVQRQATVEAGQIAGLEVVRIINEPTASALAYGLGKEEDLRCLVYDLGGGTFDVSIIDLHHGIVDVRATAGNNLLGGDDFDQRLAEMVADEFADAHHIDLRQHHQAWARLLRAAEEAKIELSFAPYALISLEYIAEDEQKKPLHIRREVDRDEFEDLIGDLLFETTELIDKALKDAELSKKAIDRVLLVGGATRTPAVWRLVAAHMGQEPHSEIDPDAAVALGAAVQAAIINNEDVEAILVDVTPMTLGIETAFRGLNGQLHGDHFAPLVRRNTTIPVQKSEIFTTLHPSQEKIHVKVYQGEHPIASQNVLLGDFMIENLKPNRPDGLTDVTISFALDVNGILDVRALERKTGKQVGAELRAKRQHLSPAEIMSSQQRIEKTAQSGAQDTDLDPGVSAVVERAEQAMARPDLSDELRQFLAEAVAAVRFAASQDDKEEIAYGVDELIDLLFEAEE